MTDKDRETTLEVGSTVAQSSQQMRVYSGPHLNIRYRPNFLDPEWCRVLIPFLIESLPWPHSHRNLDGSLSKRRNKLMYGDSDLIGYTATYHGVTTTQSIRPWSECPILKTISDMIAAVTGQANHVCVLQLYNNGEVGINPHCDKEMLEGSIIASISLYTTRTMLFTRVGFPDLTIALESGSLLTIEPPTNDHWLHSIPKDATSTPRMSLIFRNCAHMKRPPVRLIIVDSSVSSR